MQWVTTLWIPVFLMLVLFLPTRAFAWGDAGHKIVCEIAFRELDSNARAQVEQLIKADPEYTRFSNSCVWADEIRSKDRYERYKKLHYVNVPREAASLTRECPKGCVLAAIREEAQALRSGTSDARRLEALKFLGHFVGDLHQPLHVAYEDDRGGNKVTVRFYGNPQRLHNVWDTFLIGQKSQKWRRHAPRLFRSITPENRTLWASRSLLRWANESLEIVVNQVYDFAPGEDLAKDYYRKNIQTVEERLMAAGVRLGALLNRVYGSPGAELFE
jgi:hypothetical protein